MDVEVTLVRVQKEMSQCYWKLEGKGILDITVAENSVQLHSTLLWEAELVSDELGYLAEEISFQSVEGVSWFLLLLIIKYEWK